VAIAGCPVTVIRADRMSELNDKERTCPVCGRPMRLLTIFRRKPGEETYALQCRPCGLSTTKTIEGPGKEQSMI
jgi:transcription elongation factor Elf1